MEERNATTAISRTSWTEMNAVHDTAFQPLQEERIYDMAGKALNLHRRYCWDRVAGLY